MRVNLDKYLLKVEKPAQYLGNEINSIHKLMILVKSFVHLK